MSEQKHVSYKKLFLITGFFCILIFSYFLYKFLPPTLEYRREIKNDLNLLSHNEYNSVFCGMFSLDNYDTADITYYTGLNTLKLNCTLKSIDDLATYLEAAFLSGNAIDTVYLGINPEVIWKSCNRNSQKTAAKLQTNLLTFATQNPQVQFQVILSAPSLEYWANKTDDEVADGLSAYGTVINYLAPYENVLTHFIGAEEWFIANPANYVDHIATTPDGASKQLVFTLAHKYLLQPENVQEKLDSLQALITQAQNTPTEYPDLSSWDIVFFGDSIIGNYTGSTSVPDGVAALTGAHTYNCGIGGASASVATHYPINLAVMLDAFITGDLPDLSAAPADTPFTASLEQYTQNSDSGRTLCFIINYGLNDYINGLPVSSPENPEDLTTYEGALVSGISTLQENYPEALLIVMGPTFITAYSCGTEINAEKGSVLTDYVDTARMVADKTNVIFMDNYLNLGINEDNAAQYLADNIHLNDAGRFLMAQEIARKLRAFATQ